MNPTKKSFLTSIVSLVLCLTMFLGTTFAWFTDMVTSSGNIIQSGSLKIDLELLDKESGKWNSIKESKSPLFDYDKWEPGYVDVKVLKVENEGTLALKWKAMFVSDEQLSALADVIDVYVLPFGVGDGADAKYPADRNLDGYTKVGTLKDFVNTIESTTYGNLKAGESAYLGIALKMQDEAGNEYQELSLGKFNIQIVATQMANESDSFGNDYDANAEWPKLENGYAASTAIDAGNLMLGALTSELTIGGNNGVGAVLPADVKVAEGATSLELTMKKVDNDGNLNLGEGENATSFDVHIAGIATDNEKPMRVDLGAVLEAGLGKTELKLYHIENGTPVQMTRVNTVSDFAIHNQYTYDSATGNVSIYVKSFSVFSAVKTSADLWDGITIASGFASGDGTEANPYLIKTAAQLAYFRKQVDAGNTFEGKFVKLGADIDLADKPFDPIGFGYWSESKVDENGTDTNTVFMGTFDGGNHTIYNLYQNCWLLDSAENNYSTYTYSTAGGGLFASIKDATIQNLAISGAEIVFECVDMGIVVGYAQGVCHFENIVVTNSKIANYNRYTGGVVGEVSYGPYGTDTSKGYSHTFKNITVDSTVTVSGLWGSFGCGMGGVIGGKWGDATVKMENVVSAPVMDVYNDVVSAYQWYAFRGCGMLIGHTEEPYSDGRTSGNAEASFLTCEDVRVYYGDWVNYNYYEFANQDSDTGKKYPWVRAEKGEYCDAFSNIRYGVPTHDGVAVTDANKDQYKTGYAAITFDQLYGADRGMYGTATHDGVTVVKSEYVTKTIYFQNSKGWENVKLQYQYGKEGDTWTTVVDGIPLGNPVDTKGVYPIYKVTVPADAHAFTIIGDGEGETTPEIPMTGLVENDLYYISGSTYKHRAYTGQYKTIYFQNNWKWTDVRLYYWYSDGSYDVAWSGAEMTKYDDDGTYDLYKFNIPSNAKGFNINGIKNDGSQVREETRTINVSDITDDVKYYYISGYNNEGKCNVAYVPKFVYLNPGSSWKANNAVFKAYFFNESENKHTWVDLTDEDSDGIYECEIPFGVWDKMIFCRMDPKGNNTDKWKDRWNQTGNLTIPSITNQVYNIKDENVLYFKPSSDWKRDGARFAAYFFGNGENWVSMTDSNKDGTYEVTVPSGFTKVIFCRMNPSASANNWNNKWNQTGDLTIPSNTVNNIFSNKNGVWDGDMGTWTVGDCSGSWSQK